MPMSEYQRGVSASKFDIQDLKFKASLDDDEIQDISEDGVNSTSFVNNEVSDSKAAIGNQYSTREIVLTLLTIFFAMLMLEFASVKGCLVMLYFLFYFIYYYYYIFVFSDVDVFEFLVLIRLPYHIS